MLCASQTPVPIPGLRAGGSRQAVLGPELRVRRCAKEEILSKHLINTQLRSKGKLLEANVVSMPVQNEIKALSSLSLQGADLSIT